MKIEQVKNFEIKSIGDIESVEAKINEDSMPFLFEMMSKSLYSNPIGSIVREITSNCFDSHQEAGIDDAVVIRKDEDEDGIFISFIDFGVGLSPERIRKVYMNYFSSTKRDTNDQIGGFGLGSKTPLSYVDYFFINTNFEGESYQYILSKGEKAPTLDLMDQCSTKERNGTDIKIYIKSGDVDKFEQELKTQLCYFDNVYFIGWEINNDYKIYDLNNLKYRNKDQYSKEAHIILGKVSYPINWKEVDEERLNVPVGIKFEIGELQVTPNRETLRYTDEIKILVKERIKLATEELINLFSSQNKTINNYFEWFKLKDSKPYISFSNKDEFGSEEVDHLYLTGIKNIPKKHKCSIFEEVESLQDKNLLNLLYEYIGRFHNRIITKNSHPISLTDKLDFDIYIGNTNFIKEEFAFSYTNGIIYRPIKLNKKRLSYNNDFFTKKDKNRKDTNNTIHPAQEETTTTGSTYFGNGFTYFDLGIGLKIYKAIKTIRQQAKEHYNTYGEITPEQKVKFKQWKDENNSQLQRKLSGKVLVKNIAGKHSYDWNVANRYTTIKNAKRVLEAGIDSFKGIVIYGFRDDTRKLEKALVFIRQFNSSKNINYSSNHKSHRIIQIAQQNEKYFKDKPNMIHVDKLYGDNKLFRKLASSFKIEEYFNSLTINRLSSTQEFIEQIKNLCTPIGEYMETLLRYYEETSNDICTNNIERKDLKKEILDIAYQLNLFDNSLDFIFAQLDNWFKGIEIIKFTEINEESLPFIIKLLGDNKKRLNLEYYQKYIIKHKFDNISSYKIIDTDGNRIGIQETFQFDEIEENTNITKIKFLTNKAA